MIWPKMTSLASNNFFSFTSPGPCLGIICWLSLSKTGAEFMAKNKLKPATNKDFERPAIIPILKFAAKIGGQGLKTLKKEEKSMSCEL